METGIKKELILINPRLSYILFNFLQTHAVGNPVPHSLLTLSALTPQDYKIKIINQKQLWLNKDFVGDALVGITCLTSAVFEAYQLADKFRQAGSCVVLGGPHVSALPDEALRHCDSVVIGEVESAWGQVIKDYEAGALKKTYQGEALEDFFTPVYDYFLHLDPDVLRRSGIHIDRGCKYHCDFCARISQWLRFVKIEQVLELIKRIKNRRRNFFVSTFIRGPLAKPDIRFDCDNIYSNPSYAKELFKAMIPLKVKWAANCSVDIGFDEEALKLAKASGCRGFLIGFETIYPSEYGKTSLPQFQSAEDYREAIANIKAHGITFMGSFILGIDRYGHRDYLKLLWFLMRVRLWCFVLTILTPFPGSALYERLKAEGRIISFDWRKYIFLFCVIKPKHTSVLSVYAWFWFIRVLSVFFSPYLIFLMLLFFVSSETGYRLSRYIFRGF
ncbi:MAG: radical SAM protein [Candidatus Omnitrophota bacterium]